MIVVEELIGPLLNKNQIGFPERGTIKLFTTECSIEVFNGSLLILPVRAGDAAAVVILVACHALPGDRG